MHRLSRQQQNAKRNAQPLIIFTHLFAIVDASGVSPVLRFVAMLQIHWHAHFVRSNLLQRDHRCVNECLETYLTVFRFLIIEAWLYLRLGG